MEFLALSEGDSCLNLYNHSVPTLEMPQRINILKKGVKQQWCYFNVKSIQKTDGFGKKKQHPSQNRTLSAARRANARPLCSLSLTNDSPVNIGIGEKLKYRRQPTVVPATANKTSKTTLCLSWHWGLPRWPGRRQIEFENDRKSPRLSESDQGALR